MPRENFPLAEFALVVASILTNLFSSKAFAMGAVLATCVFTNNLTSRVPLAVVPRSITREVSLF